MKKFLLGLLLLAFLSGCGVKDTGVTDYSFTPSYQTQKSYNSDPSHEDGYEWAEDQDVTDFDDCQERFGTSDAEDGCNEYVKDNYSGHQTFYNYECTEDCSGHRAGYEWAGENDIDDTYDCDGNSQSFIEGCEAYVEENY